MNRKRRELNSDTIVPGAIVRTAEAVGLETDTNIFGDCGIYVFSRISSCWPTV